MSKPSAHVMKAVSKIYTITSISAVVLVMSADSTMFSCQYFGDLLIKFTNSYTKIAPIPSFHPCIDTTCCYHHIRVYLAQIDIYPASFHVPLLPVRHLVLCHTERAISLALKMSILPQHPIRKQYTS
jgi:hypothetical protein